MAITEGIVFDGLDLQSGSYGVEAFDPGLARKRPMWAQGASSDGALLVEDPFFDNATGSLRVRVNPQASMDLALAAVGALVDKIEETERQAGGLTLVWTPANSTKSLTMYVLSAEMDPPPLTVEGDMAGWFVAAPVVTISFTRKPFLYAQPVVSFSDAFGSNTIANYTVDAGAAGNVSIAAGVMSGAANLTTEDRLILTALTVAPYALPDAQAQLKVTPGTTITSLKAGVVLKRVDASNYVEAYVDDNGTNSRLRVDVVVGGVRTNRSTVNLAARATTGTALWVRARAEGNAIFVSHFTSLPGNTSTATTGSELTAAYTLAGAEITALGSGVKARQGIVFVPQSTNASVDDFSVDPHVYMSSTPVVTGVITGVLGDVSAEARLIATDRSNQSRRFIEWGVEQRHMDPTTALILDSDSLATAGFSGAGNTRTGAYDPDATGNNVIRATLAVQPVAVCGTGNQSHVGTFRVKARVYCAATNAASDVYVRLNWQEGDGPFRPNDYASPPVNNSFSEINLGLITIPPAALGSQRWTGRVEAYSKTAGDVLDVDHLVLIPAEHGYGKIRAGYSYKPGAIVAHDEFTGIAAGTVLNLRAAPAGGSWATSGATTDFAAADAPTASDETQVRSTTSDTGVGRFAILGSTNFTDTEVVSDIQCSSIANLANTPRLGVVARWIDASNYLVAYYDTAFATTARRLRIDKVIAGAVTNLGSVMPTPEIPFGAWGRIRLVCFASGHAIASLFGASGALLAALDVTDSALATGGTLATGKPGIRDSNGDGTTHSRYYDNFYAATPAAEPIALYAGRQLEARSDRTERQDASGTYWGRPSDPRGADFFLPCAGGPNRSARVLAKADRNDLETAEDVPLGDPLQTQIAYTPRYLAVPR